MSKPSRGRPAKIESKLGGSSSAAANGAADGSAAAAAAAAAASELDARPESMKVIVLGKSGTGKTCLTNRYTYNQFSELTNSTVGAAFYSRSVDIMGKTIVMGIWDTAGSERYEAMSRIYYRGARAAIVCYDLTESTSFQRTKFWVEELKKNVPDCRLYLCGTKKDIAEVNHSHGADAIQVQRFAAGLGAPIFHTSSKTGENINEMFLRIALDYVSDMARNPGANANGDTIKISASHSSSYRVSPSAPSRRRSACGSCD